MKKIDNKNLLEILKQYNNFHDGNIKNIHYDIINSNIEMELDILEEKDEKFISKSITMLFKDIQEFKMKEMFSWDFIYDLVLKTETKNNETLFLFSDDINTPNILILCKEIYIN